MSCCVSLLLLAAGVPASAPPLADTPVAEAPPIVIDIPAAPVKVPPPPAPPARLPDSVRALIDAAIASGDQQAIAAILRFARQTNPETVQQIDALSAENEARRAEKAAREAREKADALANAAFLDNWKGEVEFGASRSTGNTSSLALYGAANLSREGIRWRHRFTARADVQTNAGITTTERVSAAWQPNYKFDDRLYAFGLVQYEHDRFLGFGGRYTLGSGMGYTAISGPKVKLDVEGGPALRYTDYIDQPALAAPDEKDRATVAARASMALRWKITPTLSFAQDAALYLETGNSNASATTSLDTKLIGSLKARFSYNVQYERDAPLGRKPVDTLSRATLVYGF